MKHGLMMTAALAAGLVSTSTSSAQSCPTATDTASKLVNRAAAVVRSGEDCSACLLGLLCGVPADCAVTTNTFYAIGSNDSLGSDPNRTFTLYKHREGYYSLSPCPTASAAPVGGFPGYADDAGVSWFPGAADDAGVSWFPTPAPAAAPSSGSSSGGIGDWFGGLFDWF